MAQTATPTVNAALTEVGKRCVHVRGTLALAGTYATPGPTFDLTRFAGYPVQKGAPAQVRIWGKGSSDHTYGYAAGADLTAGTVLCTVTSTGVELAGGAFPAGITGDTIQFEVILPRAV